MNYLGRVFNNCKYIYNEINAATLTGAIDVVVVEQPDGSYTCSPFHVRFGKLGVLRSKEKIVDIEINDEPVDIHMKLGESGEAFFVEEIEDDCLVDVPPHLACSPIPPEGERFSQFQLEKAKNDERLDFKPIASESSQESTNEFIKDDSPPLVEKGNGNSSKKKKRRRSTKKKNGQKRNSIAQLEEEVFEIEDVTEVPPKPEKVENLNIEVVKEREIHFFSDTEITPGSSPRDYAPIQSDTEFETKRTEDNTGQSSDEQPQSWRWGELPTSPSTDDSKQETQKWMLQDMLGFMKKTKHIRHESEGKGIYLSDLNYDDPEMAALYFPSAYKQEPETHKEEDADSGNGTSLPQSPHSVETFETKMLPDDIGLSLCGLNATPEQFEEHSVSYNDMCQDPVATINNPKLVVKINGKLYTWRSAAPIILSMLTFRKTLPQEVVSRLEGDEEEKQQKKPYKSWFNWSRGNPEPEKFGEEKESKDEKDIKETETKIELENKEEPKDEKDSKNMEIRRPDSIQDLRPAQDIPLDLSIKKDIPTHIIQDTSPELNPDKYRKTLRLTSRQIECLNLKPGANAIVFSVTTAYQGTTRCSCFLFCWRYDDKIVISDIDGTITRSDVLGHILPIVGKDWAQNGVAKLFTNIKNNGYKVLYLSARAIGQSRVTRDYLKSIKQENLSLPEGPMLLNPTSLLNAFHREVIVKKPEEFKISCLKDIQALFPSHITPFYAGFGNKVNDVWSYRAVGVPLFRIFTINHRGELKHELTQTFQSSYTNMSHLVDQMFPTNKSQPSEDFSQFVYWREPIQDIEEAELSSH